MVRLPFIATILAAAMLNWSMTCCCSESLFVEISRGGCEDHEEAGHHEHGHAGSEHPGGSQHSCHKSFGRSFVPSGSSDDLPTALTTLPAELDGVLTLQSDAKWAAADQVQRVALGIRPPDIPLLTRSLLI